MDQSLLMEIEMTEWYTNYAEWEFYVFLSLA